MPRATRSTFLLCLVGLAVPFVITATSAIAADESYSRYGDENFPRNVYFGDTHIHSSWSADAGNMGNRRIDPEQVYRFSRGETVEAHNGMEVRLRRPLDFILLSDHAEYLGVMNMLDRQDDVLMETETGKRWSKWRAAGEHLKVFADFGLSLLQGRDIIDSKAVEETAWSRVVANADRFNDPGRFTAFIGYEWTSTPGGKNLHRNVIFADGGDRASQVIPTSSFDDPRPESLWAFMDDYEAKTSGRILAIPHNSNVSGGLMFALEDSAGEPIDRAYAEKRARREPLVEVTQYKGDSEAHPFLSPNDEFADYETWDTSNLGGTQAKEDSMLPGEYARSALKLGLEVEAETGVNPYRFGMIGSTDSHTALATSREDNFFGKHSGMEPTPTRMTDALAKVGTSAVFGWQQVSSGLAAVWAHENTRAAIFDAMERRETFATTGTRIRVRLFAGFDFEASDLAEPDWAVKGYAEGVPMGGVLDQASWFEKPGFLVRALRDPKGANLDRIQIVKGWLDGDGVSQERVYDVALSDGRVVAKDGTVPPVGNTVDLKNATYRNSIGATVLEAFWEDPDFDRKQRAFYYARVLEIPTPRWSTHDGKVFDAEVPDGVDRVTQERAYTSPVWYAPAGSAETAAK